MSIDLHLHTIFSDGTDSPAQLISNLKKAGINTFTVCDHDTADGYKAIAEIVPEDMRFISGIEFSCKTEYKKCHILGLGFDAEHPEIKEAVEKGRKLRASKLQYRLEYLKSVHNIVFSDEDNAALMKINSVGKPHLANLLIKHGFAKSIEDAITAYLTFPVKNDRLEAKLSIDAIKSAGGFVVWAHPLGGEGEKRLSYNEFESQLKLLTEYGIDGIECYYSRYTAEEADFLVSKAKEYRLLISGGSDYHGRNKNISLGELSADKSLISGEMITILQKLNTTERSLLNVIQS